MTIPLKLTPQQVTKLGDINHQYQKQTVQLVEKLNLAEKEFNHLMVGTTPASEIRNSFRQLEDLKLQTAEVLFAESLAIREVLTPEQRQQLSDRFLR